VYKKVLNSAADADLLKFVAWPWEYATRALDRMTHSAAQDAVVKLSYCIAHLTNRELRELFGPFGVALRAEYLNARQAFADITENEKKLEMLGKWSPATIKNWVTVPELEELVRKNFARNHVDLFSLQPYMWLAAALEQGYPHEAAYRLKIGDVDEKLDDFVDVHHRRFVYNSAVGHCPKTKPMSEFLTAVMEPYIRRRLADGSQYLYLNTKGEPFSAPSFSATIMRVLEKELDGRRIGL